MSPQLAKRTLPDGRFLGVLPLSAAEIAAIERVVLFRHYSQKQRRHTFSKHAMNGTGSTGYSGGGQPGVWLSQYDFERLLAALSRLPGLEA